MPHTALLIIDVQTGFLEGEFKVYEAETMLSRCHDLIARARAAAVPVIFVRHDSAPEYDGPLHPSLAPRPDEPIVSKMTPDAFHETTLQATLTERGIRHLIIAGFQTEMCIDTTTRRAFSMGYGVTLVGDAHSTPYFDDAVIDPPTAIAYHSQILTNFAKVVPSAAVVFG